MRIQIVSRVKLEAMATNSFEPRTTVISIADTDDVKPRLIHQPDHMLFMNFDDITEETIREYCNIPDVIKGDELSELCLREYATTLFSDDLADQMADFIIEYLDATDLMIFQCEHGHSRSAAVAAAVVKIKGGHESMIFNNDKYSPNSLVYEKLTKALEDKKDR